MLALKDLKDFKRNQGAYTPKFYENCSQKLAEANFKRLWIIDPSGEMVHFLAANRMEGSEALKEFTGLGYRFAPPPSAQNECVFLAERENLSGWFSRFFDPEP